MRKYLLSLCLYALLVLNLSAQDHYIAKSFTSSSGQSVDYRELTPENLIKGKKYPLVIFMHGAGEKGNDNFSQLKHGSQMFLNPVNREKFPSFVIFPQCPKDKDWSRSKRTNLKAEKLKADREPTMLVQALKELIDSYLENPSVDKSRVYIMGLSMGAIATFDMVWRYPEIFAAAIPICGAADTEKIALVKDVKWRIYHGDADDAVPVECSRDAYKALKSAGANVEYFEFPGCKHVSWNLAFSQPGFMDWLYAQRKRRTK